MNTKKTQLTAKEIQSFLKTQYKGHISDLDPLVEGEESQAFTFYNEDNQYVIRINKSIEGFKKDAYAYEHFQEEDLPIPQVYKLGQIDEGYAFCVSEFVPGKTLQDIVVTERVLTNVYELYFALSSVDVSHTTGFGDFDATGKGLYPSWRAYLKSLLDPQHYDWTRFKLQINEILLKRIQKTYTALIDQCPEERDLIHGDFGSNNVITRKSRIVALIDWEQAKYGDSFYDLASAYFWSTWLDCMKQQAELYEGFLANLPDYKARITCYQLHIGLLEIYESLQHNNKEMAEWALNRCSEILSNGD